MVFPSDQERRGSSSRGAPLFGAVLEPEFYARPAAEVGPDLLGRIVHSSIGGIVVAGQIVETEAYTGPEDEASHARASTGRTARNASMFAAAGTAYVYRIYGVHWCLNAVTGEEGHPAAVLIRAAAPVLGVDAARTRRGALPEAALMRGPGNLCRALGIEGDLDGHSLQDFPLRILKGQATPAHLITRGPRIGVTRATELALRFQVAGDPNVSGPRAAAPSTTPVE